MKKQRIFFFVIILVILGIVYYFFSVETERKKVETGASTLVISEKPTVMTTAFQNTFLSGKTQQCTVQDSNGSVETYYMTGVTVRADFSSSNAGQKVHLYADGETVYLWVGSENKGVSVPEIDASAINTVLKADGMSGFDVNAKRNLQCTKWVGKPSSLAVPYTVVFTPVKITKTE